MLCRSRRLFSFAAHQVASQAEPPRKLCSNFAVNDAARKVHTSGHQKLSSDARPATIRPTPKKSRPRTKVHAQINNTGLHSASRNATATPFTRDPRSASEKSAAEKSGLRFKNHPLSKDTRSRAQSLKTAATPSAKHPTTHSDLLSHLHKLEAKSKGSGPDEHLLERLWRRWTKLRVLPSDMWSTYSLTVLTRLVQWAGRLKGPVVLHALAKLLKDAQNTIPQDQRILHSDGPDLSPDHLADPTLEFLVVEWVRAEVPLGTTDWRAIQASLIAAGLMSARPPSQKLQLLVSHIVQDYAKYDPKVAAALWRCAEREGISVDTEATNQLCQAALRVGDFRVVLDILPVLNGSQVPRATVELLLESLCRHGIVSAERGTAEIIAKFLVDAANSQFQKERRPSRPHVLWESATLMLARSYCPLDAFHVFRMTSTFVLWSEEGTLALCDLFCKERRIAIAFGMPRCVDDDAIRMKLVHNLFVRASEQGAVTVGNKCWKALQSFPAFRPTDEDLTIAESLREAKYSVRRKSIELLIPAEAFPTKDEREAEKESLTRSSSTADQPNNELGLKLFNAALFRATDTAREPIRAYWHVRSVYSHRYRGRGDRVTANIILGATIRLHTLHSTHLRELFDMIIASGYPTEGLHPHTTMETGPVFGSPLNQTSKELAEYWVFLEGFQGLLRTWRRLCGANGAAHSAHDGELAGAAGRREASAGTVREGAVVPFYEKGGCVTLQDVFTMHYSPKLSVKRESCRELLQLELWTKLFEFPSGASRRGVTTDTVVYFSMCREGG